MSTAGSTQGSSSNAPIIEGKRAHVFICILLVKKLELFSTGKSVIKKNTEFVRST